MRELGGIVSKGVQNTVEVIIPGQMDEYLFQWVRNKEKERCRKFTETFLGWLLSSSWEWWQGYQLPLNGKEVKKIILVWSFHSFNNTYSIFNSTIFTSLHQPKQEIEFKLLIGAWQKKGVERPPEGYEWELTGYRLKDHPSQAGHH